MAFSVTVAVVSTLGAAVLARRNDRLSPRVHNAGDKRHRVVALVCDDQWRSEAFDERRRLGDVADLPAGQLPSQWVAQRIDRRMNLRAQAPARASQCLRTLFFWAPAACWCARTVVLSISSACRSGSSRTLSMSRCQTPFLPQREKRVYTVCQLPNSGCRSRHGLPVRAIHSTATMKSLLSFPVTPQSLAFPDRNGSMRAHCSFRSIFLGICGLPERPECTEAA